GKCNHSISNEMVRKHDEREVSSGEDVDEWLNEELKCKSVYKKAQIRIPFRRTSKIQEVSFIAEEEEGDSLKTLPYQQPSDEINPRSFHFLSLFGNLINIMAMADVGAGINMMPKSLFEHSKLANLKKTSMVIEMVIDTLEELDETILLGRPFLATIHAQIDVFRGEISLGVGNEKVKFDINGEICHSRVPLEKICMNVRGNGMKFDDFLKVRYGNNNIDDVTRKRRYYE
ncbi:hypothetical protein Tco_0760591, partial [Tanacetum coccineum]